MTDRGPSAEAGWGCGNVGNPSPDRGTTESAGKDCPHFHGPTQKESYMKKPRRAVAEWKAPNRNRPPTAESVGSVVNPGPEPETRTRREQGLSTAFHALRAAENPKRTFTNKPPTSGSVGRMWSIQAPNPKPECSANKDCPQAFHALRAAENEKQANDPKRQKSGTMSGSVIGSGRIGPGAALKRQNPHEPSTTRSRPDSTRILTSARYSCWSVTIAALETLGSGDARECGTDSIQKNTICALAPSLCSPSNAVSNATHRLKGLPPLQKAWDAPSLFAFFGPNAAIPQHVPVGERQPVFCAFGFSTFGPSAHSGAISNEFKSAGMRNSPLQRMRNCIRNLKRSRSNGVRRYAT